MNVYIVAFVIGNFIWPTTKKTFKTEEAVLREYDRLKQKGYKDIQILTALWTEANFEEYEKLKGSEK